VGFLVTAEYSCARAWAALTAAHARVSGLLADALARQCGLTINEFEILLRLDHAGDAGVRLTELLLAVPISQPALSRAVSRMCARGWAGREAAPEDGRGVLIVPAPAGQALLRAAIPVHSAAVRAALLEPLTGPEQELLASVLRRVAAG
jgi:DNA-binding MarR family transcriptional regulator